MVTEYGHTVGVAVGVVVEVGVIVGVDVLVGVRVGVEVGGVPVLVGVRVGVDNPEVGVGVGVCVEVDVAVGVLLAGGVLVGVKVAMGVHGARHSSEGWSPGLRMVRAAVILTAMPPGIHRSMNGVMKRKLYWASTTTRLPGTTTVARLEELTGIGVPLPLSYHTRTATSRRGIPHTFSCVFSRMVHPPA